MWPGRGGRESGGDGGRGEGEKRSGKGEEAQVRGTLCGKSEE